MNPDKQKQHRECLALVAEACTCLYLYGFLTDKEHANVHKKIGKYQDKYRVNISRDQLDSVTFEYTGD